MNSVGSPSLYELFNEFSLTQSPFERWKLFKFFGPQDAMMIYMPGQTQSGLCTVQELIYNKMLNGTKEDQVNASVLLKWLSAHKNHLSGIFKTCSPKDFWHDFSLMTTGEIKLATNITQDLFILFNLKSVFSVSK